VADGGVLAHALLLQAGVGPDGGCGGAASGDAVDIEQAQTAHVGAVEGGMLRNGGEGVGALIPEGGRVGFGPDAEAVQHDQKYTFCHMIVLSFRGPDRPAPGPLLKPVYHILTLGKRPGAPKTKSSPALLQRGESFSGSY